jgi:hypothetical protein
MSLVNMHDVITVASPLRTKPPLKHAAVFVERCSESSHIGHVSLPAYTSDTCLGTHITRAHVTVQTNIR